MKSGLSSSTLGTTCPGGVKSLSSEKGSLKSQSKTRAGANFTGAPTYADAGGECATLLPGRDILSGKEWNIKGVLYEKYAQVKRTVIGNKEQR